MTSTNKNSFEGLRVFLSGTIVCFLLSFNSFGQSERGMQDVPKNTDELGQFESPESNSVEWKQENAKSNSLKSSNTKSQSVENAVRRENPIYRQGGEKENRKEGMSTLSFNLFLYIVDKFKED